MPPDFLIVGLGNPGREYRTNRHNVGFMLLDRLAASLGARFSRKQSNALVTTAPSGEHTLALAKPQTYMNLSGGPVASLLKFYRLPLERLLVCYDELDLPVGAIRMRAEGGAAGHNGMRSITHSLGTGAFPRLRIGIGRPSGERPGAGYVLSDFRGEDAEAIDLTLDRAVAAVLLFASEGLEAAMNRYNA